MLLTGRLSVREEESPKLLLDSVRPLDGGEAAFAPQKAQEAVHKLYIKCPDALREEALAILRQTPGNIPVILVSAETGRAQRAPRSSGWTRATTSSVWRTFWGRKTSYTNRWTQRRKSMKTPVLYIVIPCYNEEEALPITAKRMAELLDDLTQKGLIDANSRVTLVDDGSRDRTWEVICALNKQDKRFEGVKLAHNAGHMNALWAGMRMVCDSCDALVTIGRRPAGRCERHLRLSGKVPRGLRRGLRRAQRQKHRYRLQALHGAGL